MEGARFGMWAKTVWVLTCVSLLATGAAAQEQTVKPWEMGISGEQRTSALARFTTGNAQYSRGDYNNAAESYRQALTFWSHPRIHGNLSSTLIKLEKFELALIHIEEALRYGEAAFDDPNAHDRLLDNRRLLQRLLSEITVVCRLPGATVTLDGSPLLTCPGQTTRVVRVGSHQLVAKRSGYLTVTRDINAVPGKRATYAISPVALEEAATVERRWSPWFPWTVVGAGIATVAVGIPFQLVAQDNMNRYDQAFQDWCPPDTACTLEAFRNDRSSDAALKGTAERQSTIALSLFTVGAAAIVTGGILVYLNQPRAVELDERGRRVGVARFSVRT